MLGRALTAVFMGCDRRLIPASASLATTAARTYTDREKRDDTSLSFEQRYTQLNDDPAFNSIRQQSFAPIPLSDSTPKSGPFAMTTAEFEKRPGQLYDGVPYEKLPVVYIQAKFNNTRVSVMEGGKIYSNLTCKNVGFFNAKKNTELAGETVGATAAERSIIKGCHSHVRVVVRGIGVGRKPSIRGLAQGGLKIVSITDKTPITNEGLCQRPRKIRRI